ncbi:hypothetical protein GR328_06830 [Microvirga makkahensis]|uniref:Uncharacterized protein n=1 Tax=Microvirga makkahensis TaxID=1128670 RepID=A0A7X3MQK2_9HYPH|nr:hypothetical protein [Microvirga makkahensis]
MLKAPANIALAAPQLATKIAAVGEGHRRRESLGVPELAQSDVRDGSRPRDRVADHHGPARTARPAEERESETEREEIGFVARHPYAARLLDLLDLLGSAYRLAKE